MPFFMKKFEFQQPVCNKEGFQGNRENKFKMSLVRNKYDTEIIIIIIGGLRNCDMILCAIDDCFKSSTSLNNIISHTNALTLRTEKSKIRVQHAIRKGFLEFISPAHYVLMQAIFTGQIPFTDKVMILVWQFALNNRLMSYMRNHQQKFLDLKFHINNQDQLRRQANGGNSIIFSYPPLMNISIWKRRYPCTLIPLPL